MCFIAFDCEGPLTLNDNAFEFTSYLIPKGEYFFTQISRFDDYLAYIKAKPGYKAGDTLKLLLPFLRLFGATNKLLEEFSERTLSFLKGIPEVLPKLYKSLPLFIISTSYKPYLVALCKRLSLPYSQVFCTEVDLDRVILSNEEKRILRRFYEEIINYPLIELPREAKSPQDLSQQQRNILDRLEEIFFEEIWNLECGVFLREVNPIGGEEKARACALIADNLSVSLSEGFYCGDSITDVQALELIKKQGGISLSFNGNRYALKSAEFYALADHGYIFEDLVKIFRDKGPEGFRTTRLEVSPTFEFGCIPPEGTCEFLELVEKSETFRKKVRGEAIGSLG
ncbi:MAG: hypothetical protein N2327_06645 [Caldimicrobium sp.]|nr:hypothetical protein [Caldimicrobium sp.]MCX7874090.1 hypothetical protein [Caldimicrobium sp.]MDW8093775.1 hypothetical protein [Caldimicrobium sp.]